MTLTLIRTVALACLLLAAGSAAADEQLRIEVDISERELRAYVGDKLLERYDVSVGTDEDPTPEGAFSINKIVWNPAWNPPPEEWAKAKTPKPPGHPENPMKKVKVFFREPDYYIHGTDDKRSLGRARSHGCVRMSPSAAEKVAKMIMLHGGQYRDAPWYKRIFRSRKQKVVMLVKPVPMVIQQ